MMSKQNSISCNAESRGRICSRYSKTITAVATVFETAEFSGNGSPIAGICDIGKGAVL